MQYLYFRYLVFCNIRAQASDAAIQIKSIPESSAPGGKSTNLNDDALQAFETDGVRFYSYCHTGIFWNAGIQFNWGWILWWKMV